MSRSVDTINSQILFLRKTRLNIFAPISDLSSLSRTGLEQRALIPGKTNDVAIAGGQILGDEYSRHVVKVSYQILFIWILILNAVSIALESFFGKGEHPHIYIGVANLLLRTLLKSDQWHSESTVVADAVRGAINFRHIEGTRIYALGQPTLDAIDEVVERITSDSDEKVQHILWITLREEPIVYVNGEPFCLRRESFSLRNMKGAQDPIRKN